MSAEIREAFDKAYNEMKSKLAFDALNQRDAEMRRMWGNGIPSEGVYRMLVDSVRLSSKPSGFYRSRA
jgi:hypothetical protein